MFQLIKSLMATACSISREIASGDSNKLSHTKVFSSLGYITGTWIMVYQTLHNTLNTECFIAYLTIVAAHSAFSKYVGKSSDTPTA